MPDQVAPPEPPKDGAAAAATPPASPGPAVVSGGAWPPAGEVTKDERTMAMLAWLLGIFTGFVGPLVLFIVKKEQSKFVAFHAMQALFFELVVFAAIIIIVVPLSCLTFGLGGLLGFLPLVVNVMWGLKANSGDWAELPVIGGWAKKQVNK